MSLRFTKMQGIGNDFVVLDRRDAEAPLSAELARRLADRHFGIGCDQVMTIERNDDDAFAFRYGIYNADGSAAGQCGNGLRCVVRWLADRGLVRGSGIHLLGPSGPVQVDVLDDGCIRADMGVPEFDAGRVPLATATTQERYVLEFDGTPISFGAVSMGNPHAVIEVDDVATASVGSLGSRIEVHPMFPDRVNVGFVQVIDRAQIKLRVFERGVGETLACGSGACAAVAVLRTWQCVDAEV
ncbi:MAG TPA: diaminopimelate epimerase, partial [Patescibacteria group bacterium]|nr:diaminopimelate epimerase [Patescibacteria group bacterium]